MVAPGPLLSLLGSDVTCHCSVLSGPVEKEGPHAWSSPPLILLHSQVPGVFSDSGLLLPVLLSSTEKMPLL